MLRLSSPTKMLTMRTALFATALLVFLCNASAQSRTSGPLLINDLCTCMGHVDVKADDHVFLMGVRQCMEDGVVDHPGEVLALLKRYPDRTDKAYLLGLLLGGALEGSCDTFHAVKARLQTMPGQGSVVRPGS